MKILGINTSHNASICQVTDGVVDFYLEEDRFNKIKNWYPKSRDDFSFLSIEKYAQNYYDKVVIASWDRRMIDRPDSDNFDNIVNEKILNQLKQKVHNDFEFIFDVKNHHLYHAYSGFYFSNYDDAIIIIMDGSGAQPYFKYRKFFHEMESVYYFNKNTDKRETLYKRLSNAKNPFPTNPNLVKIDGVDVFFSTFPSSGQKFSGLTKLLGLGDGNEAGKTMGLASYGKLIGDKPEDLARQLQEETKLNTFELIKKAISYKPDCKNIVLSGGYSLNCVNNYEYVKEFPEHNFFVDPVAHDGGTAIGAALWTYQNAK